MSVHTRIIHLWLRVFYDAARTIHMTKQRPIQGATVDRRSHYFHEEERLRGKRHFLRSCGSAMCEACRAAEQEDQSAAMGALLWPQGKPGPQVGGDTRYLAGETVREPRPYTAEIKLPVAS